MTTKTESSSHQRESLSLRLAIIWKSDDDCILYIKCSFLAKHSMMLTSGRDTLGGGGVGMCGLLEDMSHCYIVICINVYINVSIFLRELHQRWWWSANSHHRDLLQ